MRRSKNFNEMKVKEEGEEDEFLIVLGRKARKIDFNKEGRFCILRYTCEKKVRIIVHKSE